MKDGKLNGIKMTAKSFYLFVEYLSNKFWRITESATSKAAEDQNVVICIVVI